MRTPRVERLRAHARDLVFKPELTWEVGLLHREGSRSTLNEPWHILRRGREARYVLSHFTPVIDADELIVGKAWLREMTDDDRRRMQEVRAYSAAQPYVEGLTGHTQIDLDLLLKGGCRGLQEDIRSRMAPLAPARPDEQRKLKFYEACLEALEGLCEWAANYAAEAERQAATCADAQRRSEFERIAEVCRHVPAYPARTFHEALQAVHFANAGTMMGQGLGYLVPGRIDRYLLPYYRADIAAGRLTPDEAQELLDCAWIAISEYVHKGGAVSVMVGGPDADGRDITNEITYMALQGALDVGLAYPTVAIAWHPGTPTELLDRAVEVLAQGTGNPALFNDVVISAGMRSYGIAEADCHNYINSTCVEITPVGASNIYVASPYFNVCGELLPVIAEAVEGTVGAATFADLLEAYKARMSRIIAEAVELQNTYRETRARHSGKPLQSCFTHDCLERGADIDEGGARCNWIECSFVGLANLVDSLNNLRRVVYETGEVSLAELKRALDSDFAAAPELGVRLRDALPRYGCDDPRADAMAQEMTSFFAAECAKHEVRFGGAYVPGFFCYVNHEQMGRVTGATPDGRRAGFAFADGAGPSQGSEREGPTAAIRSTASWDQTAMLGGLVLNLKFTPDALASPEGRRKVRALLQTAMELGVFEVQVNCIDRATLLAAQATPEVYRDLVVRVAGYSDYFVNLTPGMQAEVIARTQFG